MKRMKTLTCIVLALSLLLGLGLRARRRKARQDRRFPAEDRDLRPAGGAGQDLSGERQTGVEVEVWPIAGDDYYQNLKTYMASESGPTVFTLNSASRNRPK